VQPNGHQPLIRRGVRNVHERRDGAAAQQRRRIVGHRRQRRERARDARVPVRAVRRRVVVLAVDARRLRLGRRQRRQLLLRWLGRRLVYHK